MSKRKRYSSDTKTEEPFRLDLFLAMPVPNDGGGAVVVDPDLLDQMKKNPQPEKDHVRDGERRAKRPKCQPFDEITIRTIPRLKDSEISGSEWRFSAQLEIKSKGKVLVGKGYSSVERAVAYVSGVYAKEIDCWRGSSTTLDNTCDQEGCYEPATGTFKLKATFTHSGKKKDPYAPDHCKADLRPLVRKFCSVHSYRGDCGLEDADDNYERIDDPTLILNGDRRMCEVLVTDPTSTKEVKTPDPPVPDTISSQQIDKTKEYETSEEDKV